MTEAATTIQGKTCPKCGAALEAKAIACPSCGAQVAKARPDKIVLTMGQKIAAAVFILNGLALVAEAVVTKDADSIRGVKGALISIAIGAYLYSGKAVALKWAKYAAILGGVIFTAINFAQGDVFSAVTQLVFSLALLGLLFGQAGKIRLAICCLALLGYFGLEAVGLYMTVTEPPAAAPAQNTPKT